MPHLVILMSNNIWVAKNQGLKMSVIPKQIMKSSCSFLAAAFRDVPGGWSVSISPYPEYPPSSQQPSAVDPRSSHWSPFSSYLATPSLSLPLNMSPPCPLLLSSANSRTVSIRPAGQQHWWQWLLTRALILYGNLTVDMFDLVHWMTILTQASHRVSRFETDPRNLPVHRPILKILEAFHYIDGLVSQ